MPQYNFTGPFVGINLQDDAAYLTQQEAADGENVMLDRGTIQDSPGWSLLTQFSAAVRGIHDYQKNDGTIAHLVKAGTKLYRLDGWAPTEIGSGFDAATQADFTTFNNRVYVVDGLAFKVTDGTTVYNAVMNRPTGSLTPAATGSAQALRGSYDYKYTYYSTTWGQESTASNVSVVVAVDEQSVNLTGWDVTTLDARTDKLRIYRRKTSVNETEWLLAQQVSVPASPSTVVNDNVRDVDVSLTELAPFSVDWANPPVRLMGCQSGVCLFAGEAARPTRVYYTRVGQPWRIENFLEVGSEGDGEPVTAIFPWQGRFLVGKENSVWVISGNSPSTFFTSIAHRGVGIRGHHTVAEVDGVVYWLGLEGIYVWDGERPLELSHATKPRLVPRAYGSDREAVALHDYDNSTIVWSFASAGSTSNDRQVAHFYRNSRAVSRPSWFPWSYPGLSAAGLLTDPTTRRPLRVIGFSDGKLGLYGGSASFGGAVKPFRWRTGRVDVGSAHRQKKWGGWSTEFTKQTTDSFVNLKVGLDGETPAAIDAHNTRESPISRTRIRRRARDLQVEYQASISATPVEVVGWTIDAEEAGRSQR